jgi:L-lactate dehydrogenase complex protein LldG
MEPTEQAARERILRRIRSALAFPSPVHGGGSGPIFPPVADPLARFRAECTTNITECILTANTAQSATALEGILDSIPRGEVYMEDAPALRRIAQLAIAGRPIRWSTEGPPNESSQATITLAASLVASTGSVLLASSAAGRGASVVAPVHIVVASKSQLEPDLDSALAHARRRGLAEHNSCLFLITGSSRTADIEKILVLGAHGPRRLVVLLAEHLD